MAYIWFNAVLEALGKRINYDSISNLYGNSFAKDAAKVIQAANPLIRPSTKNSGLTMLSMPGTMHIIESGNAQKEQGKKALGDTSWFEEFIS